MKIDEIEHTKLKPLWKLEFSFGVKTWFEWNIRYQWTSFQEALISASVLFACWTRYVQNWQSRWPVQRAGKSVHFETSTGKNPLFLLFSAELGWISLFIVRINFQEPAKALREAIRSGVSLKDRLSIKLENDVRKGEVRFDHWSFFARVCIIFPLCSQITVQYWSCCSLLGGRFALYHRISENRRLEKYLQNSWYLSGKIVPNPNHT